MITYTRTELIARPPQEVFDFAVDQANLPIWSPEVVRAEVVGGGEVQLGSTLRQIRMNKGKEMVTDVEVIVHDRPGRHTVRARMFSVETTFEFTFRPTDDGGTRAQMKASVQGRWFGKLMERTMARMMESGDDRLMARLGAALEGHDAPEP